MMHTELVSRKIFIIKSNCVLQTLTGDLLLISKEYPGYFHGCIFSSNSVEGKYLSETNQRSANFIFYRKLPNSLVDLLDVDFDYLNSWKFLKRKIEGKYQLDFILEMNKWIVLEVENINDLTMTKINQYRNRILYGLYQANTNSVIRIE